MYNFSPHLSCELVILTLPKNALTSCRRAGRDAPAARPSPPSLGAQAPCLPTQRSIFSTFPRRIRTFPR